MSSPFRDRSLLLSLVGAAEILVGLLLAALGALSAFAVLALPEVSRAPGLSEPSAIALALSVYPVMGAAAVTLGIGLLAGRRWARALSVIAAWSCAILGVLVAMSYALMGPRLAAFIAAQAGTAGTPAGAPGAAILTLMLVCLAIGVFVVPGTLVGWLLGSEDARLTCEWRDRQVRWTDRCPLPVLALALFYGYAAVVLVPTAFAYPALIAGRLFTGPAAVAFYLVVGAAAAALGVGTYRLRPWAWLGSWLLLAIGLVNAVGFSRGHGLEELYAAMRMPAEQAAMLSALLPVHVILVLAGAGTAAFAAWLLLIRKHFVSRELPTSP